MDRMPSAGGGGAAWAGAGSVWGRSASEGFGGYVRVFVSVIWGW